MKVTGSEEYYYIGHSMGTLTYFTACNYEAWVCNNTRLMVGYGPHTVVPHLSSPLFRLLAKHSGKSSSSIWKIYHDIFIETLTNLILIQTLEFPQNVGLQY